ncbi:MAG: hypothetical protein LBU32_06540 [Clostridiales bacterium]|nr:hypothetical protein [Clostridiales bacterium]
MYGLYPDGSIKQTYTPNGAYHALCSEYKAIADNFSESAHESGKRDSSILTQHHAISVLLLSLKHRRCAAEGRNAGQRAVHIQKS